MSESLLSTKKECFICGKTPVHKHHVFGGANRKLSEKDGCWVWLCPEHHNMSDRGVHFNRDVDLKLKERCQSKWQRVYGKTIDDFRQKFGKSWI